jgi:hypothetical protein
MAGMTGCPLDMRADLHDMPLRSLPCSLFNRTNEDG